MKATLRVTRQDGAVEEAELEYSDSELKILKAFCAEAWNVRTSTIFFEKAPEKFSLSFRTSIGFSITGDHIDVEAWQAALLRFRPLLLEKEPSSFYKVAKTLGTNIEIPSIRGRLKELRQQFRGELAAMQFRMGNKDSPKSMDEIFYLWLNAYEYHRDEDKKHLFEGMKGIGPEFQLKQLIYLHAIEKLKAILGLMRLVVEIFGDSMKPPSMIEFERQGV